jgi:imidazolonepropionase-like amidohydrolase
MMNNFTRLAIPIIALLLAAAPVAGEIILVNADRMLEVRSGRLVSPASLVIENGLITAINPATTPASAQLVQLGDMTLLPGLMDMHTHLTLDFFTGDDWVTMPVLETAPDWAIRGVNFARSTLQAGFTTVRDVGANTGFPDVALMRAIERGTVPGPDMWPAGHYISITGGHCDVTGFAPGVLEFGPKQGIADGVDEVIKAVRYQAKHGVRIIKVCDRGGSTQTGDEGGCPRPRYCRYQRRDTGRCCLHRTRLDFVGRVHPADEKARHISGAQSLPEQPAPST